MIPSTDTDLLKTFPLNIVIEISTPAEHIRKYEVNTPAAPVPPFASNASPAAMYDNLPGSLITPAYLAFNSKKGNAGFCEINTEVPIMKNTRAKNESPPTFECL